VLVWVMYLPHWPVTHDANLKLAVFCTGPAIRHAAANFVAETIATAAFVFAILGIGANAQTLAKPGDIDLSIVFSNGLQPLLVGGLVLGVGLSLGGPTGYAINPARDLGPRIAHFVLPIDGKRDSDWGYAWVPIVAPIVGGVIGAQLFKAVGF
jgi:glycerol uptake facilitator